MIRRADPVDQPPREQAPGAGAKGALFPLVERIDDHNPLRGLLAVQAEVERRITMEADRMFETTPGCLVVADLNRQWLEADAARWRERPVVEEHELYPDSMPRGGAR